MARPKELSEKSLTIIEGEVDAMLNQVSDDILRKVFITRNCFANKITKLLSSGVLKKIHKSHNDEYVTRCVFSEISHYLVVYFRLTREQLKRGDRIIESQFKDNLVKIVLYSDKLIGEWCSQIATYCDFKDWEITYEQSIKLSELFVFEHEKHFVFTKGEIEVAVSDKHVENWICENIKHI